MPKAVRTKPPDPPDGLLPKGVRAKRNLANKDTSEYVVKASLRKSLVNGDHKQALVDELLQRVEATSKGAHRLSLAIHLLLRTCFDNVTDFRNIRIPTFLSKFNSESQSTNTLFARHLMLGTDGCRVVNPFITTFLNKWNHSLPLPPKRCSGDSNTYNRVAEQFAINYRTFLETTFKKKQFAFMEAWGERHCIDKAHWFILARMVNGWELPDFQNERRPEWIDAPYVQRMVTFHREMLRLTEDVSINEHWMKTNYETMIVYYGMLSNYLVKHGKKAILLAPMNHMRATYVHIDADVLYGIMKQLRFIDCNFKTFKKTINDHWESLFRINHYTTERQRQNHFVFTGTVQTDGVAICIHYRRPLLTASVAFEKHSKDRVIGVDPGRVTLFTGVEIREDGSKKVYTLNRARYYLESGFTKANKQKDKWHKSIRTQLNELAKHTYKGTSMKQFIGYLETVNKNYNALWGEYLKRRWGRQRFATYSGKKSTIHRFLESLKDDSNRRIVLAYGDAGFAHNGPGELSVPTSGLQKQCAKKYKVVPIDEFRTSQIHHWEDQRCAKVYQNGFCVRGLLWCNSTNVSKFVNRDVNAALNILRCYENTERPLLLRRGTPPVSEPQSIALPLKPGAVAKKRRRDPGVASIAWLWEPSLMQT